MIAVEANTRAEPIAWQSAAAAIVIKLGHDRHLADCGLAKKSGPDATLACAYCGRALWMHATRHDTCGSFCWVTDRSLTDRQLGQLAAIAGLPEQIRHACAQALNDYALAPYYVKQARQLCATAINIAKREARKELPNDAQ